jgi:hypothetical protein
MNSIMKIVIPINTLKVILKAMTKGERVTLNPRYKRIVNKISLGSLYASRIDSINQFQENQMSSAKTGKLEKPKAFGTSEYKDPKKEEQKNLLITILRQDEDLGLYDL